MKKRPFLFLLTLVFAAQILVLALFAFKDSAKTQDAVAVNEAVQSVQADWDDMSRHENHTAFDYVVLQKDGTVRYRTKKGLSESLREAVIHRDAVFDISCQGKDVGKLILYNDGSDILRREKQAAVFVFSVSLLAQLILCACYLLYFERAVVRPFQKLKGFAARIAGGDLDIPLEMDRQNLFGAFTESFDIMRAELKKARIAEAKANTEKKELIAKLSHDVKTPVASIKAVSELGLLLTENEKVKNSYAQIIQKADQVSALIGNLFSATVKDLGHLSVTCRDMESSALEGLLKNADYKRRAAVPDIPGCLLYADPLRLQQVFDNLFANSYKYADTDIDIKVFQDKRFLTVCIEDRGGGADENDLPLLKEKFKRGVNAAGTEGAGLGLCISDYFMKEMRGGLILENGADGLKASVLIALSGA